MDPFESPYWSQLQVVVWVYTRSRAAVRLAADRRPMPRGLDDDQGDPPAFDDDFDLIADVVGCRAAASGRGGALVFAQFRLRTRRKRCSMRWAEAAFARRD